MRDEVVIVTGAAAGVGAEVVRLLRSQDARVVAVDRKDAILSAFGSDQDVLPVCGDVADAATASEAVAVALQRFGRVDGLVNNAGRFLFKPLLDTSVEEWDALFAVNVRSMMLFCKAVLPHFLSQGGGAIVNLASISGLTGAKHQVAYGATKGATVMLTKALAIEHAADGVRVNAVAPGAIDTGFVQEATGLQGDAYDALARVVAAAHPLGRMAEASEIAHAVSYLLSTHARFVTGVVLPVDGGYTAQ